MLAPTARYNPVGLERIIWVRVPERQYDIFSESLFFFWVSVRSPSYNESELYTLIDASKEAQWLCHLYQEVLDTSSWLPPMMIYCDNKGTIDEIQKEEKTFKNNTKHIDRCQDWLRFKISEEKMINVKWIDTKNQLADMFTKALPGYHLKWQSEQLGLQ